MNRSLMGLPALSPRDIERECLDLEARRKERKLELKQMVQGKRHHVNKATLDVDSATSSSDEAEEEEDDSEHPRDFLINEIKLQRQRYALKGKPIDDRKVMKYAFRNYNQKFFGKNQGKQYHPDRLTSLPNQQDAHTTFTAIASIVRRVRAPMFLAQVAMFLGTYLFRDSGTFSTRSLCTLLLTVRSFLIARRVGLAGSFLPTYAFDSLERLKERTDVGWRTTFLVKVVLILIVGV